MDVRTRGDYELADRELIAEGADLRVQVLTLAAGPSPGTTTARSPTPLSASKVQWWSRLARRGMSIC